MIYGILATKLYTMVYKFNIKHDIKKNISLCKKIILI